MYNGIKIAQRTGIDHSDTTEQDNRILKEIKALQISSREQ